MSVPRSEVDLTTTENEAGVEIAGGRVWELSPGKLTILSNPYALDGRVSSHPRDARGFAPIQTYALIEGDRVLLSGTGLSIQQDAILEQLAPIVEGRKLSLIFGYDFQRLCNARPIADRFGVDSVYQSPIYDVPPAWLNFRPQFPQDETDGLRYAREIGLKTGEAIQLGAAPGERDITTLTPPLRLFPSQWFYDGGTRTLFSVDVFTWNWRHDRRAAWVIDDVRTDDTTIDDVRHALFDSRYWWLPGAETSKIRRNLANIFDTYQIENIAPEYGCVLKGTSVVSKHYNLLDEALAAAPSEPAHGIEVGSWTFAGAM